MDPKPEDKTTEETVRHEESGRTRTRLDLLSHKVEKEQLWGGIDELTLARYEAGLGTDEERARVEQAMRDHPPLRECLEFSRELAAEWDSSAGPQTSSIDDIQSKSVEKKPWVNRSDRPEAGTGKLRGKAAGEGSDDELWPLPEELLRNRREWSKTLKEKTGPASDLHEDEEPDSKSTTNRDAPQR